MGKGEGGYKKMSRFWVKKIWSVYLNDDYNKQCTKENDDEKNNIKCSLEGLTPRKKYEEKEKNFRRKKWFWCKIYAQHSWTEEIEAGKKNSLRNRR